MNNNIGYRFGSFAILWLFPLATLFSQNNLSGYVKDIHSELPIIGANIVIIEQNEGTSSDVEGFFNFANLVSQEYHLRISHLNYLDTLILLSAVKGEFIEVFLSPDSIEIASVVVTATRTRKDINDVPQRVNLITKEDLESFPATNTDNLLKMVPGLVVNRSWGIFSRNAAVTMRGMPGSSRSLVLVDGVPLNKSAGGTVNWHLITPEEIEKIEIVKGPGSALYGNNAMGGVINIITKQATKRLNGFIDLGYGSYNTVKSQLYLDGSDFNNSRGLFWKIGGFYRQGDGYVLEPEDTKDTNNVEAYLYEGNLNGQIGYRFNQDRKVAIDYRFYKDKRGSGEKVYEKDGGFESFVNNNIYVDFESKIGNYNLSTKAFYLNEFYSKQDEKVNNSGEYKLSDIETEKDDYGIWMSMSRFIGKSHNLTTGLDIKFARLDNKQIYRTSSDQLFTEGKLLFSGLFVQDDIEIIENKLRLIAGLRLDYSWFYDGGLQVSGPTDETGFLKSMDTTFANSSWMEISPKISMKYFFPKSLSTYLSFSTGFMPPRLDDLVGSRKIRKGFKIANPDLRPETIKSFEWGMDWDYKKKLAVKPSLFYSIGDNFQYLVATGEFIDEGSEDPTPVYQRQNVSKVSVKGAELGIEYRPLNNIGIIASYAYNYSKIIEYDSHDDTDLTGKYLNEVPENIIFLGFNWKNRIVNLFIDYNFTDDQWFDEENTQIIEAYSLINVRLSKQIMDKINLSIDVQDLFNTRFIDRKGYLSPGRFIMFEIKYSINN